LRNFTAFSARSEPELIMGVLSDYYGALGPIITKYEATQTCFSGDGLMMLVNAPVPCEEPALHAVNMSIEMQAAVQRLAADWRRSGYGIGFGIGLAKGPATVGRIGYESRLDYTAIGHVVNLASRLCSMATDGQILTDAVAAAEVRDRVTLVSLGSHQLRGIEDRVEVHAVADDARAVTPAA
jgi:class 3 adenylate cyclase